MSVAMAYRISEAREGRRGHYVVFTSSTEFAVPADVTYLDALAIGGGGGGMYACSRVFGNLTKAGDGGDSRVGRYLRAGGGRGGSTRQGEKFRHLTKLIYSPSLQVDSFKNYLSLLFFRRWLFAGYD